MMQAKNADLDRMVTAQSSAHRCSGRNQNARESTVDTHWAILTLAAFFARATCACRALGHSARRRHASSFAPDDDLQAALDRARPGDTLLLEAGATYTGNFVLPAKDGTRPIVIRSATTTGDCLVRGAASALSDAALLPKLKSPNIRAGAANRARRESLAAVSHSSSSAMARPAT